MDRKDQALDRNKMLQTGVGKLQEAQQIAMSTHQTTIDIMGNMQDQRLQIQNATNKIDSVKGNAEVTGKYINSMERRELIYKSLLVAIIVLLFLAAMSLLYIKFTRYKK